MPQKYEVSLPSGEVFEIDLPDAPPAPRESTPGLKGVGIGVAKGIADLLFVPPDLTDRIANAENEQDFTRAVQEIPGGMAQSLGRLAKLPFVAGKRVYEAATGGEPITMKGIKEAIDPAQGATGAEATARRATNVLGLIYGGKGLVAGGKRMLGLKPAAKALPADAPRLVKRPPRLNEVLVDALEQAKQGDAPTTSTIAPEPTITGMGREGDFLSSGRPSTPTSRPVSGMQAMVPTGKPGPAPVAAQAVTDVAPAAAAQAQQSPLMAAFAKLMSEKGASVEGMTAAPTAAAPPPAGTSAAPKPKLTAQQVSANLKSTGQALTTPEVQQYASQVFEAYRQATSVPPASRSAGQQRLIKEVGKLQALTSKSLGTSKQAGNIADPVSFRAMMQEAGARMLRGEQGFGTLQIMLPIAGGAIGSTLTDDPAMGLIGGALGGVALANPAQTGRLAQSLRVEGFLSGAAIPKNIAASVASPVVASIEQGSLRPALAYLNPKTVADFGKALVNPSQQAAGHLAKPNLPSPLGPASPSRIISAVDDATSKALLRGGVPKADVERILLTADNPMIRRAIQAGTLTLSPQGQQLAQELARIILPFQRTPANVFSQLFGETAALAPGSGASAGRRAVTLASPAVGYAIGEWAAEDPVRRGPIAGIFLAALGSRGAIGTMGAVAALPGYGRRQVLGGISPIPEMAFDLGTLLDPTPAGIKFLERVSGER